MTRITTLKNLTISTTILSHPSFPILSYPTITNLSNKQQTTKQIPSTRISTRLLLLFLSPLLSSHPLPLITTHPTKKTLFLTFPPSLPPRNIERSNERNKKVKLSLCLGAYLQVDWAAHWPAHWPALPALPALNRVRRGEERVSGPLLSFLPVHLSPSSPTNLSTLFLFLKFFVFLRLR